MKIQQTEIKINVNIFNESCRKALPRQKIINIAKKIFLDAEHKNTSINIIFVDYKKIKKINREFLKHNYATDVNIAERSNRNYA